MSLQTLVPDRVWHACQPLRVGPFRITSRMTVIRLRDGALWVHSPIMPTKELMAEIAALGEVRYVVAPNRSHHLFFLPFVRRHPRAQGFIAPGLAKKRPDLERFPVIQQRAPWSEELPSWFIEGLPILGETVWFHRDTGTLVLTDLLFCFGREHTGLGALIAKLLGVYDRLAMSHTMKLLVSDKRTLRHAVEPLLSLPVQRIVLAHDQVVEDDAANKLRQAFAWLAD